MTQQSVAERPPFEVWQAEVLRLTAFPSPSANVSESTWWTDLTGKPPETVVSQPRRGLQQMEGMFEGGKKLVLITNPARINWLLNALPSQDQKAESLPTLGSFPKILDMFFQLMLRWFDLETCPSVQRLAFGATLLQPTKDLQSGYQQISSYLSHVRLEPEGFSDFLYQINRPRDSISGIKGLRINRLSKWFVEMWQLGGLSIGSASIVTPIVYSPTHFACRLDLDINTTQDFQGELTREQLPKIFRELVELGKEIAREGDIK